MKHLGRTFATTLAFLGATSASPRVAQERHLLAPLGPLGYWNADDGSPPAAAADVTGNGRHGAFSAGTAVTTILPPTKFPNSGSFELNGAAGVISVPDSPALRITGDFTVAFWMRRTSNPGDWVRVVGKGNGAQRNFGIWLFPGPGGQIKFQMYNTNGQSVLDLDSPGEHVAKLETWTHIVCTVSVNAAALHMNGVTVATGQRTGEPGTSADPLTFGFAGYHAYYAGQLDDIRIYNRALSMSEVVYLAGGNGAPSPPGGLTAPSAGAKQVVLQWTASAGAPPPGTVTNYIVKRSTTPGRDYAAIDSGLTATTCTDATAEAGKTYYYIVTAVHAGGESEPSNELKVVFQPK
jgi:hypothetical protein